MRDLALPADIPGLLRIGSVIGDRETDIYSVVVGLNGEWVTSASVPTDIHDAQVGTERRSAHLLMLDNDTGMAHAAWWLADRVLQTGGGPHVGWHFAGLRPGWLLYAEGDTRQFVAPADAERNPGALVVPELEGLPFMEDREALRRVCLRVHEHGVNSLLKEWRDER